MHSHSLIDYNTIPLLKSDNRIQKCYNRYNLKPITLHRYSVQLTNCNKQNENHFSILNVATYLCLVFMVKPQSVLDFFLNTTWYLYPVKPGSGVRGACRIVSAFFVSFTNLIGNSAEPIKINEQEKERKIYGLLKSAQFLWLVLHSLTIICIWLYLYICEYAP